MPDRNKDITHFTRYFNINAPNDSISVLILLLVGAVTGVLSAAFLHWSIRPEANLFIYGASSGIIIISLPALLTVVLTKGLNRRILLKHMLFAATGISLSYSIIVVINSAIFSLLHNYAVAYVLLLAGNAGLYSYWFILNRILTSRRRSLIIMASIQPILNVLFYIPMSPYLFSLDVPVGIVLIKLWAGMLVFMGVSYAILYIMDRPARKALSISGIDLLSTMVNEWLYDVVKDVSILANSGVKKDVNVNVLALKGREGYKAVFVKPDIHYGPFNGVGGSAASKVIGAEIARYGAAPFVMHGAVTMDENPISSSQIRLISKSLKERLDSYNGKAFSSAQGYVALGREKHCSAINISIGNVNMFALTKAPLVTEDIDYEVGMHLAGMAGSLSKGRNIMLIDAHNSRLESASYSELRGVYKGSKYVQNYERAIGMAAAAHKASPLRFGCSTTKLSDKLKGSDIGDGFTSVAFFEFGKTRYCVLHFDGNNMLPALRARILRHIRSKFGVDAEVFTTDTHSVNSIAHSASNVLGRYTRFGELLPTLDSLISEAIRTKESVTYAYSNILLKDFKVWGKGSEAILTKVGRETIRAGKRKVPFLIVAGFIIAAWIIYIA